MSFLNAFIAWPRNVTTFLLRREGRGSRGARRVHTPNILQMEAVECGAAALAIVLGHFRRFVPLENLRAACGVSRDGSKASNIVRAARTYGLLGKGYRKEPAELRELPVPMIVHWNFNHFVVVEGFRRSKVFLNDPACGPKVVSAEEFDEAFTGVVLTFERGPEYAPGGERPGLLKPLARRFKGMGLALAFAVLVGVALLVPGLVSPAFNRTFIDQVLVKGLEAWMRPLLLLMVCTGLLTLGLTALRQRYLLRFENRLSLSTSSQFFWHVLRLPIDFFNQRYAGEIGGRVAINDQVARLLSGDLATTALNMLVIAMYAVVMLQHDLVLSLVAVGTAVFNIAALRYVARTRKALSRRMVQDRGKLMATAMGGLQTIETLKAGGSESDFFSRWSGYQAKVVNGTQQLQVVTLFLGAVPPLLLSVNTALVLGIGGLRVMDGYLTIGMLMAFMALAMAFLTPVNKLVSLGGQLQEVEGNMNRLDDVLRAQVDPALRLLTTSPATSTDTAPSVLGTESARLDGYLELRNVSFGYSRLDPPLVEGFNLSLKPGSRVALVGSSGSGKSTVAKLVVGLYEPWTGEILFDGRPRQQVPRSVLSQSMALVDQDISMFEGTIADNLTLWDSTIAEQNLIDAAKDACIHDDITARAGGYDAMLEEGGRNFSGGQRQRLEIARALALNPRVLVLDEATSALDPMTEKAIDDNLRRRGCTCLIVAHRLSTIRDCDEIIVLQMGKIVERGTHEQMQARNGSYARLIASEQTS